MPNETKTKKATKNDEGLSRNLEFAAKDDFPISKDQIREYLERDIKGVYILLADLLRSREAIEALVNVFHARYEALRKSKQDNDANPR